MTPVNRQYGLQADSLGFLISQKRIERTTDMIGDDVKQIVTLLKQMQVEREKNPPAHHLSGLSLAIAQASKQQTKDVTNALNEVTNALSRQTIDVHVLIDDKNGGRTTPKTVDVKTPSDMAPVRQQQQRTDTTAEKQQNSNTPSTAANADRKRDSNGRFTSKTVDVKTPSDMNAPVRQQQQRTDTTAERQQNSNNPSTAANADRKRDSNGRFTSKDQSWFDKVKTAITGGVKDGMTPPNGVDPTVDAVNELGTLFSPVTKAVGFMFKPISTMWRNRKKKEPLSDEENRHNRRQIKLLDAIAKALGRNGGGRAGNGSGGAGLGGGLFGGLFGRLGKAGLKGLLKKLPIIGGLLALLDAGSDFFSAKTTEQKGAAVGMGTGAVVGGVLGSLLGPIGTIVGSMVGAWVGEQLGGIVAPYFADLVDGMGRSWDEKIAPFFAGLNEFVKEKTGIDVGGTLGDLWNDTKEYWLGSGDTKMPATTKQMNDRQMQVFQAFKSAGFNDEQAKAMTAEIGREGDYQDKYLFGGHSDPKNKKSNLGMFSWQGDRREKLIAHMKKRGLVNPDGTFMSTQESLNAQAEFAKKEIDGGGYEATRKMMANNPNAKAEDLAYTLGKNYVGWRIDDPVYAASGNARRRGHLANLEKQIQSGNGQPAKAPDQPTEKPAPKPVMQSNPDAKPGASGGVLGDAVKAMQSTGTIMVSPPLPTVVNQARVAPVSAIPPAPSVKVPMRLPPPPAPKPAPERMGSRSGQQQPQTTAMSDGIGQNVADRDIAHVVTGGIGSRTWNG